MHVLTPAELMAVWERGFAQRPPERALTLLAAARPDLGAEELLRLPIGKRDAEILALREDNFGPRFSGVTRCPQCGEQVEIEFTGEHVRADAPPSAPDLAIGDVQFRLPDSSDLIAVSRASGDARALLLERCTVSGAPDDETVAMMLTRMEEADPQANVALTISCPTCDSVFARPFDIVAYLWTEIVAWASRVAHEVHVLASAYGWRESEILAMTPWRRQLYLEQVQ
jgi:hypothetical protein